MKYSFENGKHLQNFCKKVLRNNGIELGKTTDDLLGEVSTLLLSLEDKTATNKFTWRVKTEVSKEEDLLPLLEEMGSYSYDAMIGQADRSKYPNLFKLLPEPDDAVFSHEFISLLEELSGRSGVYAFLDADEQICYVGKSIDLGSRLQTSSRERKRLGVTDVQYALIPENNVHIYEMYLISQLEPTHNTSGKTGQKTSLVLPEVNWSEPVGLWIAE